MVKNERDYLCMHSHQKYMLNFSYPLTDEMERKVMLIIPFFWCCKKKKIDYNFFVFHQ